MKTLLDFALMCRVTGLYPKFFGGMQLLERVTFFSVAGFSCERVFSLQPRGYFRLRLSLTSGHCPQ